MAFPANEASNKFRCLDGAFCRGWRKESCRRSELREDAKMNTMKIYVNQRKLRFCAALVIRHPNVLKPYGTSTTCVHHQLVFQISAYSWAVFNLLSANGDFFQICTSCCLLAQATAKVVFAWACGMSETNLAAHDLWPFLETRFGPVPTIGANLTESTLHSPECVSKLYKRHSVLRQHLRALPDLQVLLSSGFQTASWPYLAFHSALSFVIPVGRCHL